MIRLVIKIDIIKLHRNTYNYILFLNADIYRNNVKEILMSFRNDIDWFNNK